MLEVVNISKIYQNNVRAVQNISFVLSSGEICGVLGPNGAGKTTTIRMILSIISPDSGEILWNNKRVTPNTLAEIGYLPEERGLYKKSKIGDTLAYFAALKGIGISQSRPSIKHWLEKFGLGGMENRKIEELSKGNQQKVQFIASVVHKPSLLILDEPFSGLDPANQQLFADIVHELAKKGTAIIFCTHQLESAETICDRFVILNKGKTALNGTLEEIRTGHYNKTVRMEFVTSPNAEFAANIQSLSFVKQFSMNGQLAECELDTGATLNDLATSILPLAQIIAIETVRPSLLSIFLNVTGNKKIADTEGETNDII